MITWPLLSVFESHVLGFLPRPVFYQMNSGLIDLLNPSLSHIAWHVFVSEREIN